MYKGFASDQVKCCPFLCYFIERHLLILISNRIGAIAMILSKRLDIDPLRALKMFYKSQTCANLHDKSTGLYLYGDPYVADEFMLEIQQQQ